MLGDREVRELDLKVFISEKFLRFSLKLKNEGIRLK